MYKNKKIAIVIPCYKVSRNINKVISKNITNINYAVVGTYSLTTRRLNVFIKLIDVSNGNILASSYESIAIDDEIIQLERKDEKIANIRPQVVL